MRVEVKATGLMPRTSHAVHLHAGSCEAQSSLLYPLTDVTADGSGAADVTSTLKSVANRPPAFGWYIDMHVGSSSDITSAGLPTPQAAPLLCGNITTT
jgi:hypothetical protein